MDWQVFHTRTFLKELSRLPQTVRTEAEKIAFGEEIKSDVFLGGRVQKLTGYQSYYKRYGSAITELDCELIRKRV